MKVLLSVTDGFLLGESGRCIYSPGYTRENINKTEHECLVEIVRLAEVKLKYEGVSVIAKKYAEQREACFPFDKARAATGDCDAAVLVALNSSQNSNAQFGTVLVNQQQEGGTKELFESMMFAAGRFTTLDNKPVPSRYPNSMKRIPYLDTCRRSGIPAVLFIPFFFTDRRITTENLGELIESSARALVEGLLSFNPTTGEV